MQELNRGWGDTTHKYNFVYSKQMTPPQQGSAEEYNTRGISHAKNDEYDLAITAFRKSIEIKQDCVEAYCNIGIVYGCKGEYDLAIAAFRKSIKIDPYYAEAYCYLGIVYDSKGEYDLAIKNYTQATQLKPEYAEAYNNRGITYGENGEFDLAIKDFTQAIKLKLDYAKAYNNRGAVYCDKGDLDKAIKDCTEAIRLNPDYAEPYSNRGAAYRNKGEISLAIQDYDRAIELEPYFFKAYYNRAMAYYDKREYDLALENYSKAIELRPQHAHPYNNRGNVHLLKGDFDLAIQDYNRAIKLNPALAHAYYNLGEAWLRQQEWEKAKTNLNNAMKKELDIVAAFRNGYKNVEAFEREHQVKLPADIVRLVWKGFRYRYPIVEKDLNSDGKPLESPEISDLLERFRNAGTPLGEYVKQSPYFGIETVPTEVFVINGKIRDKLISAHPPSSEILKPFFQGQDVRRWQVRQRDQWLIFTYRGIEINDYPAILQYLEKYRNALNIRGNIQKWYELPVSLDEASRFAQPKLVCPNLYNKQTFAVEAQGLYCGHTCYIIPTEETWLCGLLNTLAVEWFYSQISKHLHTGELEARSGYIKQIPIPNMNATKKDMVRILVDYLIYLQQQPTINSKKLADSRDFAVLRYFESIINGLIYEFYLPDVLQNADRDIFKHLVAEQLPELEEMHGDKMSVFRSLYEHLRDREHPIRVNLFFQDSLRPIRIIEDKW